MKRGSLFSVLFFLPQICDAALDFGELTRRIGVSPDQQLTLILWLVGGSFIALLAMGLTNRVVVFADGKDLGWTLLIVLGPVISFVVAATLTPEGKEIFDEPIAGIVIGVGGIVALVSMGSTFILSIKHNGMAVGIVVGLFKVLAGLLALICALGLIGKIFDNQNSSPSSKLIVLLFFGLLLWTMKKLINGEAVYARRTAQP